MNKIKLFNKIIKKERSKYFFILEAGTNHYELADYEGISVYDAAIKMIIEAAATGADAIKFQVYKAEALAHHLLAKEQYNYMRRRDTLDYKDYKKLAIVAKKNGINFMLTLFDLEGIKELGETLDVFKVASPDITNYPLLKAINEYKKPVIISTAGALSWEIKDAITLLKDCNVVIMHCRAIYPTPSERLDLGVIKTLNKEFPDNVIGWSSHIPNPYHASTALSLGANILEFHFKISVSIKGGDYPVSINYADALIIKRNLTEFQMIYGNDKIRITKEDETLIKNGRRGLYAIRDIQNGERISHDDFVSLRPAVIKNLDIIKVNQIDLLNNKRVNTMIPKNSPLLLKYLEIIND